VWSQRLEERKSETERERERKREREREGEGMGGREGERERENLRDRKEERAMVRRSQGGSYVGSIEPHVSNESFMYHKQTNQSFF